MTCGFLPGLAGVLMVGKAGIGESGLFLYVDKCYNKMVEAGAE